MAYEMKPNSGSLFKNDRKESDTHPDYKGSALIDGLGECWADAWINEIKSGDNAGKKYLSFKLKPKEDRASAGVSQRDYIPSRADEDDDDFVPF